VNRLSDRVRRDLHVIADRANPSPTAWNSILARIDAPTDDVGVEVVWRDPNDQRTPSRTRIAIWSGVAASAVLITVAVVAMTRGGDDADRVVAVDETRQAIDLAQEFVAARDRWDGEAVRALVADDAEIVGESQVTAADDYLVNAEFERVTEWRFRDAECAATEVGPPIEVTCTYVMENAWSQALGVGPFTGSSFTVLIDDGQIQQVTHSFDVNLFSPQVFEVWVQWLNDTHSDDVDTMYDFTGPVPIAHSTPEALNLQEQYTDEFIAVRNAVSFIEARDRWDGEAVRAMVADDAEIVGENQVTTADDYLVNAEFERVTEWRFMEPECAAIEVGPPARVSCFYVMENAWSRALGVGPFTGSRFTFEIDDGQIQEVDHYFDYNLFGPQAFEVWVAWLIDNHPDDVDAMYDFDGGVAAVLSTPEALAFQERYTDEFVESQTNSGADDTGRP
jgi:hypothetical protein